jgi:hypothetical protein
VNYPAKLKVGVHAINAVQQPLSLRFEDMRLKR